MNKKHLIYFFFLLILSCNQFKNYNVPICGEFKFNQNENKKYYIAFYALAKNKKLIAMSGIGKISALNSLNNNTFKEFIESFYSNLDYSLNLDLQDIYQKKMNCINGNKISWYGEKIYDLKEKCNLNLLDGSYLIQIEIFELPENLKYIYIDKKNDCLGNVSIEIDLNEINSLKKVAFII